MRVCHLSQSCLWWDEGVSTQPIVSFCCVQKEWQAFPERWYKEGTLRPLDEDQIQENYVSSETNQPYLQKYVTQSYLVSLSNRDYFHIVY